MGGAPLAHGVVEFAATTVVAALLPVVFAVYASRLAFTMAVPQVRHWFVCGTRALARVRSVLNAVRVVRR